MFKVAIEVRKLVDWFATLIDTAPTHARMSINAKHYHTGKTLTRCTSSEDLQSNKTTPTRESPVKGMLSSPLVELCPKQRGPTPAALVHAPAALARLEWFGRAKVTGSDDRCILVLRPHAKGTPESMVCSILVLMWSLGPLKVDFLRPRGKAICPNT